MRGGWGCTTRTTSWKLRGRMFVRRQRMLHMRAILRSRAKLPSYVRDWLAHREPGGYWAQLDVSTRLDRIRVPALHMAGWFDTYLSGSTDGYLALRGNAGSEFARDNQYLIASPWVHHPW